MDRAIARQLPVLVIEDEQNDVLLLQRAFKKSNVVNPLRLIEDGETAMAYLSGSGEYSDRGRFPLPIVVLLDIKLPRMSGFEILEWIKSQPDLSSIPVVVLTSSKEGPDLNKAYRLGANSYLCKPVSFEALVEIIQAIDRYWLSANEIPG